MIWLMLAALAAPTVDEAELVDALVLEMDRAKAELALGDSPEIYHLRYKLMTLEQVDVGAEFGGLLYADEAPYTGLGVEIRIGEPSWDNTGFGGWQDGFRLKSLPGWPTADAVRLDAWRLTDRAFKDAVEQYSRKQAQAVVPPDYPGDYTLTGASVHDGGRPTLGDRDALVSLAQSLSMEMSSDLELGRVYIGHEAGSVWLVDTEGSRVRLPVAETTVRAVAHLTDERGLRLTDARLWTVREAGELPDAEQMRAEVREMTADLHALAKAPTLKDEYVGPVLFEGAAAGDLFRYVLLSQLEGTPAEIPFDTFVGDIAQQGSGARMLRRVLPPGWTVHDDPTSVPSHPGSFTHDWEGTPAQSVRLVEDGIVRGLVMSRVPRSGADGTNGHARGGLARRAIGKTSLTTVTPAKALPEAKLRKLALRASAAYGRDHVIVVRRLQHPGIRLLEDDDFFGEGPTLPPPVEVIRLYADGREERVKGAVFSQVQRWVLRDIAAAGRPVVHDFLSSFDGDDSLMGPTQGTPCRLVVPSVLVGELELLPASADPSSVRTLTPPK